MSGMSIAVSLVPPLRTRSTLDNVPQDIARWSPKMSSGWGTGINAHGG
ncbi:MAG: hypothetical protein ACXVXF_00690 [Mycobacteriaceae bacterium]